MPLKYRDSQKRFYFEGACYFITTNTKERYPFFRESIFCDLFVENLRLCKKLKGFKLYGWVLCFDHFHWLIQPSNEFNYSKIMQFLKRHVTRDINYILYQLEGAIRESRLRVGNYVKLQPTILDHDEQLKSLKSKFIQKYPNNHPFPQFKWHKSFHDHFIRDEEDFMNHLEYMEYNPIKHNLPKNWPTIFSNPKYADLLDEW